MERKTGNKYMNAMQGVSLGCKGYVQHTLRNEKNWERDGLICARSRRTPRIFSPPIFRY